MDEKLLQLLIRSGGAFGREDALREVSRHALDNAVKSGGLGTIYPRAYAEPWAADDLEIRWRAALASVGGEVALSHTSALELRSLPVVGDHPVHVKAYQPRHPRGVPGRLVVHRTLLPLAADFHEGFPVVPAAAAVVDSWPLMHGTAQRAPMIEAVRRRLVTADALAAEVEARYWVAGISAARALAGKVLAGCESELELYGYDRVFDVPELRDATRQLWVQIGERRFRLDLAFEAERLNVELDGRKYHAGTAQWERDIARDRLVARIGWQTLRYSHDQLHADPLGCRREIIAVRRARSRLLRTA